MTPPVSASNPAVVFEASHLLAPQATTEPLSADGMILRTRSKYNNLTFSAPFLQNLVDFCLDRPIRWGKHDISKKKRPGVAESISMG